MNIQVFRLYGYIKRDIKINKFFENIKNNNNILTYSLKYIFFSFKKINFESFFMTK